MTNEELTAIRERYEKANAVNPYNTDGAISNIYQSVDDVPKLLAENEKLRNERDELMSFLSGINEQQEIDDLYTQDMLEAKRR